MPLFILSALAWVRSNKLVASLGLIAGLLIFAVLLWQVGQVVGARRERTHQEAADARAVAQAAQRNSAALEAAAAQRRTDEASAAATEKELTDAVKALPDSVPSARRVALGCARLRRAGQDVSGLPQCA